jgi:hypothetical protein
MQNNLTRVKLALALMGAIVFGYGMRVDSENVRWGGVALLACAFLLRFVRPRSRS